MERDPAKRSREVEQAQGMLRQNIAAAKEMVAEAERLVNCSRDPSRKSTEGPVMNSRGLQAVTAVPPLGSTSLLKASAIRIRFAPPQPQKSTFPSRAKGGLDIASVKPRRYFESCPRTAPAGCAALWTLT